MHHSSGSPTPSFPPHYLFAASRLTCWGLPFLTLLLLNAMGILSLRFFYYFYLVTSHIPCWQRCLYFGGSSCASVDSVSEVRPSNLFNVFLSPLGTFKFFGYYYSCGIKTFTLHVRYPIQHWRNSFFYFYFTGDLG